MKRARNKKNKRRFPERETRDYTEYTEYTPSDDTLAPSEDSEPNDFAVPDEVFDTNVGAGNFDNVSEEEVPFSTGDCKSCAGERRA